MADTNVTSDPGVYTLTTIDNPWDPFTEYEAWYAYDLVHGYHTPGLLARVAKFTLDVSDEDQDLLIEEAIDEIIREDILGIYIKTYGKGK